MPITIKKGTSKILGVSIPDFGFTEKAYGSGTYAPAKTYSTPAVTYKAPSTAVYSPTRSDYQPSQSSLGGSSSGGGSKSSGSSMSSSVESSAKDQRKAEEEATNALMKQIDSEFNNVNDTLGQQESQINTQLPLTEGQIGQSYESAVPGITQAQGAANAGLDTQQQTAETQTGGVLNQARRTYNELISGAQKFGGSAGEAFGELLGRGTAETMGAARNALVQTITAIKGEKTRVNDFYNQKLADLQKEKVMAIEQARADARNAILTIQNNRTAAQRWKADQNMNALATLKQSLAQINAAEVNAKNAIAQWAQSRQDTLDQVAQQKVQDFKVTLPQANQMAQTMATTTGNSLNNGQLQGIYGTVGKDANTVDWNKIMGNVAGGATNGNLLDPNAWSQQ